MNVTEFLDKAWSIKQLDLQNKDLVIDLNVFIKLFTETDIEWFKQFRYEEDSNLRMLLTGLPDCDDQYLGLIQISLLGIMWCDGDLETKANELWQLCTQGAEDQEYIHANRIEHIFEIMFTIASATTVELANDTNDPRFAPLMVTALNKMTVFGTKKDHDAIQTAIRALVVGHQYK